MTGPGDPDQTHRTADDLLGRRDWDLFADANTPRAQRDLAQVRTPWTGRRPRRVGAEAQHDRTLGIERTQTLWPDHTPPGPLPRHEQHRRAAEIIDDLRGLPRPPSPLPAARRPALIAALTDVAARAYNQPPREQLAVLRQAAAQHRVDPGQLAKLAVDVGTLIARAGYPARIRPGQRPGRGKPSLNALHGANLPLALDTHLARTHLRWASTTSDPDLPRLWILANGLTHGVPAHTMLTVPATVQGPAARLKPTRDDLIGWYAIQDAVGELDAAVRTAAEGRRWLATAGAGRGHRDDVLLGLGILDITHPGLASALALRGPGTVRMAELRRHAERLPVPAHFLDLSDVALKAVCDRNGWLLGTPDERQAREIVERGLPDALTDTVRAQLADCDITALARSVTDVAPTDQDLDRRHWRWDPAASDAVQVRQLLGEASREAHARFAGWNIEPRPTRAAALLARFPERAVSAVALTAAELAEPVHGQTPQRHEIDDLHRDRRPTVPRPSAADLPVPDLAPWPGLDL
ncbi:hypothetical protein CcI49_11555 [Frankia sp. CcI49]|uniref:hypothetical protein n=1 Tax=Frankia sp. CcI49 TaxID=1745382 RepID=UPI000978987A|nr:hypothetical protein [Frankia sp. CcI49]ONH60458.1 hypothetical protein CcI49_11555 [Frankia sp. CcI49]